MGLLSKALGFQGLAADDGPVGDYSADVTPPARSAAPSVTVDRAVTLPAVFRAIQIIQTMTAQLVREGLGAWRDGALVTPTPALVRKPDPWRSRRSFAARFATSGATDGNVFLLRSSVGGFVTGAQVLDPFATFIRWENGVKKYDTVERGRDGHLRTVTRTDAEVLHVWTGLELPGHDRALGPIAACRVALGGHLDSRAYAAGWFAGNDVPSGVLSSDQRLDPTSAAEYKRQWLNPTLADGVTPDHTAGPSVRVLGQGLTYSPIMLKPSDAQWLESQAFGVVDVARMFGMPPGKLAAAVEGSSLTYATPDLLDRELARDTLLPVYIAPLEDALTELLVRGQEARVAMDEWLRPDPKTQADIDAIYLDKDVISPEEVRVRQRWAGPAPKPKPAPAPAAAPAPKEVPA